MNVFEKNRRAYNFKDQKLGLDKKCLDNLSMQEFERTNVGLNVTVLVLQTMVSRKKGLILSQPIII